MARHLKAVGPEDAAPDPQWVKDVDELAGILRNDGEGVVAIVCHPDGSMTPYAAGTLDLDRVAGFAARFLAAMANEA